MAIGGHAKEEHMCYRTPEQLKKDGHPGIAKAVEHGTLPEGSKDFEKAAKFADRNNDQQPIAAE